MKGWRFKHRPGCAFSQPEGEWPSSKVANLPADHASPCPGSEKIEGENEGKFEDEQRAEGLWKGGEAADADRLKTLL